MLDIPKALRDIESVYGIDRFISGDCHNLAVALLQANKDEGSLFACIRKEMEEDGTLYSTTYSHMIYECGNAKKWDIDGADATERWEFQWRIDAHKDGLCNELEWIKVEPENLGNWLGEHFAALDTELVKAMSKLASSPTVVRLHAINRELKKT